jgi:hypothetical protein
MQSSIDPRQLRLPLILAALAILAFFNWRHAVVRLVDPWSNVAVFFVSLVLPLVATLLAWSRTKGWYRVASILIGLPWSFASWGFALLVSVELTSFRFGEPDQEWTPIQTVAFGPSRVVVYQTDSGAPCALGIVLRQEMDIGPGLLLVRDVWARYPAETVRVDVLVLPDGSVTVDGSPLSLRFHVYF